MKLAKFTRNITVILVLIITSLGCEKVPGMGGNSSIKGSILVEEYDQTFSTLFASYDGADVDVYIVYGESETYDDRVKTSPSGVFEFEFLRKGAYQIYTYSKDSTLQSPSGMIALTQNLEITKNKQQVEIPQLTVFD
ncbi:MAG: hypothetical protein ACI9J3_001471 [Parvicellaceae bacterium]|jgi:hypothetical protein